MYHFFHARCSNFRGVRYDANQSDRREMIMNVRIHRFDSSEFYEVVNIVIYTKK